MSTSVQSAVHPEESEPVSAVFRKVTIRLIPLLFVCFVAAYLDRVNVGFAKLQMVDSLEFSDAVYGLGAGLFFVGYILFEVPSNMVMQKVGAKLWIARIMFTWGLISAAMALVNSPTVFYILRFLLGVAEAGFIPGVLFYLTQWFPAYRRGKAFALFLTAIPVASIFGAPLSGWILETMDGFSGLEGWQWIFIIEALPSLILTGAVILWLDNDFRKAKWLNAEEKALIEKALSEDNAAGSGKHSSLGAAFKSGKVWLLCLIYFCIATGIYVVSFWLPSIIDNTGVESELMVGLLTAIPFIVAIVVMLVNSSHADKTGERRWHTAVPALATAMGFVVTGMFLDSTLLAVIGLAIAAAGASTAQTSFWSLPPALLTGAGAAAGIALVNSVGNIAGFVSTYAVGVLNEITGSSTSSLYVGAGLLCLGAFLTFILRAADVNDKGELLANHEMADELGTAAEPVTAPQTGQ